MIGILLQIVLLLQGIPILPNQGGTITGVLMSEARTPASGVRIAAMAQPDNFADVISAASLVSIAETDESGRFRLENVPPGRYYITAGRVENPTYYPGTLDIASGRIVAVATGAMVSGVDFILKDGSDRDVETINAAVRIPLQLHVEDGVPIPVFSEHGKVVLRFTHVVDGIKAEVPIDASTATLPIATGEYQVEIDNLPDEYVVTSLTFGSFNLMKQAMKITLENLPAPAPGDRIALTSSQSGVLVQRRIPSTQLGQARSLQSIASPQFLILGSITSNTALSVSLITKPLSAPAQSGVRIRGKVENAGQQELYISGTPGTLYADGTFEFRNVLPGRHLVAMFGGTGSSRQRAAVIVVGKSDMENLELRDTIVLPSNVLSPSEILAGSNSDTSTSAMHSIRGHVVEGSTHQPVAGIVTFRGYARSITYSLPADGEFEIPDLLPGSYNLKIETFDRSSVVQTVVIANSDVDLNLSVSQ